MSTQRCVLLFSIYYPPTNATLSGRAGGMAKYLPKYGWMPMVVSGQAPAGFLTDRNFVRNLPPERLVAEIPYDHKSFISSLFPWEGIISTLRPGFCPATWVKKATKILSEIFEKNDIHAVWATYPPAGPFYLANYCLRKFRTPWIADFRDVPGQHHPAETFREHIRAFRDVFGTRKLVANTAGITTVSKGLADILREQYGPSVHVVRNGFDPESVRPCPKITFKKFSLLWTGSVYGYMSPRGILDALAMLLESRKVAVEDIEITFYCKNSDVLKGILKGYPFRHLVNIRPRVTKEECDEICRSSAILLLGGQHPPGFMTSKLFAYLSSQRPILVGPGTCDDVEEVLKETNAGVVCSSVNSIADTLLRWYQEWRRTGTVRYKGDQDAIMKYSYERQAGELAGLLDSICLR